MASSVCMASPHGRKVAPCYDCRSNESTGLHRSQSSSRSMRFRCCINEKAARRRLFDDSADSLELRTGVADGVGNIELLEVLDELACQFLRGLGVGTLVGPGVARG